MGCSTGRGGAWGKETVEPYAKKSSFSDAAFSDPEEADSHSPPSSSLE